MKNLISISICFMSFFQLIGQNAKYEVALTPITIADLGGIQSYAVGTYEGEWLIIGGRLDGLHRRQPWATFNSDGNNQDIIVVNPTSQHVWKKSVESLPTQIKEQLSSTNMQFYQDGNDLILTGGYGYSPTNDDHITYPLLTIVDIPDIINAVKNGQLSEDRFQQIENEIFQVAGGRLGKIDEVYYLVGGHKFMGRYNPMGPDHGPGFVQEYTNEIRKFTLNRTNDIDLDVLSPIHDEMHLHKRDYNLVPSIIERDYGLVAYSGVFQNNADLPWLYPVKITDEEYVPVENFTQYFNHYHCATLPIYDESKDEMHTLFFGGIAQFYMDGEIMVQDNDVPFVNTIADISLTSDGQFEETVLSTSMPGYLGAGSEFIFSSEGNNYAEGILSADIIGDDFVDVGYIYGGIRSSLPNIFWINTGTESEASNTIYKVSIRNRKTSSASQTGSNKDKVLFYPNPAQKYVRMSLEIETPSDILVDIFDTNGEKIHSQKIIKNNIKSGSNLLVLDNVNIGFGAFVYKVTYGNSIITRKVIWTE